VIPLIVTTTTTASTLTMDMSIQGRSTGGVESRYKHVVVHVVHVVVVV
jgi:hypothetical protein